MIGQVGIPSLRDATRTASLRASGHPFSGRRYANGFAQGKW
ncbi:hypothetical protein GXM_02711 [Nostoc sphaeroides CCNUC1]|uniref:Uncharacterized protein n=1 Tax=Nostoc sphaeroides CCNUC1 TaxID=2653204 RepID=A0A5P8VXX2_9NOSO|nr:hypothetical protein GXM_02711 [Nostoc sphaeroides CCNUC1]